MSAQPPKTVRKTYAVPSLRCYGSVVATTRGSVQVGGNDVGAGKKS